MKKLIQVLILLLPIASFGAIGWEAVDGEYVVTFKPQSFYKTEALNELGAQLVEDVNVNENVYLIKVENEESFSSTLEALNSHPDIEIAEPNFIYRVLAVPNDPMMSDLWGMQNVGQKEKVHPSYKQRNPTYNEREGWKNFDMDMNKAWDISTGSKSVVVGVIDTGVDYTHEDLKANIWVNEKEKNGTPFVDDDGNGYIDDIHGYDFSNKDGDPMDDNGHGTHVAGTIGASGNNGVGVAGVNWNVRIMGIKFLSKDGGGTLNDAIKSIDYATKNNVPITNNSWGGGGFSAQLEQSIQRNHAIGAIFVAAAGNSNRNNDTSPAYPASYITDNILSVAAIGNRGDRASFSNYGRKAVDVGAPGNWIVSTTPANLPGGKYQSYRGTSMASPHAAGVAALLKAVDPKLSGVDIKKRIMSTVVPTYGMGGLTVSGGMVNAYHALINKPAAAIWPSQARKFSTPHPYVANSNITHSITINGAKKLSVRFSKFETERLYDKVEFYDSKGNLIDSWDGDRTGQYSPVVEGDTISLKFTSDSDTHQYGFDIDSVTYSLQ